MPCSLDQSLYQCKNVDKWDSMTCENFLDANCWAHSTKLLVEAVIRGLLGVEPSEISLLNFLLYCNSSGGVEALISIPKGNKKKNRFSFF